MPQPAVKPMPYALTDETNVIRFLALDAVEKATCGHPGMPMGMAEIASVLWREHLRHNPANPKWPNRDRFVLSNGHGSMLLYALLHLTGYDLPMSELAQFRQLHSKTPGHPEHGLTPGVETTTGPLGQGLANAVGMALAEKILAKEFNQPGLDIVNHRTWAFLGDGCLMEGISHEVCSLAGTWELGKLICFYDDNSISIDGNVKGWFTDDTASRFRAYGWHVIAKVDGHNIAAVDAAIHEALKQNMRPTLICCQTIIGMGSPNKAGTHDVHGATLGAKEVAATREKLGWSYPPFVVPESVRQVWDGREKGKKLEDEWRVLFARYKKDHPELAEKFTRQEKGVLPAKWSANVNKILGKINAKGESIASRKASQNCLEAYGPFLPELVGGSADLTGSNLTKWSGSKVLMASGNSAGNYIHYGVREFGMCAIGNGLALHGGLIPYSGTFLVFSDYARNALRMAALMKVRQIFVFTHDSIGLGEDGPTHQPIEQVASLRLIPNMDVWRPCDSYETAVAWAAALERSGGPTSLCLSRQNLPFCFRETQTQTEVFYGGYVLREGKNPRAVIIATGSEVDVALKAQALLQKEGVEVRVVSMPSTSVFERQSTDYKKKVLPDTLPKVSVEAGATSGWRAYVGLHGATVGIDRFGESAPAADLYKFFAVTVDEVAKAVRSVLK